jgi:hypothetical protein
MQNSLATRRANELSVRTGASVRLYSVANDGIGMEIVMNADNYKPGTLPPKHNVKISKDEINRVRPDIGQLIFHLQGSGAQLVNP